MNDPRRDHAADTALPSLSEPETAIAGMAGEGEATRGGEDTRRRGWFWHWNSIVTQYAPLIGLKGVGLLNSYTVWTDRRDESPHRGYAFPSQQREADFYGEDRAELIAINKILVALDLIEIRKEMVLRADEQGRRWRVPHNFYRVKDHGDDFALTTPAVLRVVELADADRTVYRYVRRIFSDRFAPIDRDNIWVTILEEVRQTEIWQRLAARASRDEQRASDRSRAGHVARKSGFAMPETRDTAAPVDTPNDSAAVIKPPGLKTSVAPINTGSGVDVVPANTGSEQPGASDVAPVNSARSTSVAPINTTYYQSSTTTTTTDGAYDNTSIDQAKNVSRIVGGSRDAVVTADPAPVTASQDDRDPAGGSGPGGRSGPSDMPGEAAATRAFEDANGRVSSAAERQLLRNIAERFEPAAFAQGDRTRPNGWAWVTAGIYEAVEAGSSFVAPRRIREILLRWEREGLDREGEAGAGRRGKGGPRRDRGEERGEFPLGSGPEIALPHGQGSRATWAFAVRQLAAIVPPDELIGLAGGSAIAGYREGEVTVAAVDDAQAEMLSGVYSEEVARALGEAMRRPVRVAVIVNADARPRQEGPGKQRRAATTSRRSEVPSDSSTLQLSDSQAPASPVFVVAECGLPNAQVWAAVLDQVAAGGRVSRSEIDLWLRPTQLLGRGADDALIVGVSHPLAQRRIASRMAGELQAASSAVIGMVRPIELVVTDAWLRASAHHEPAVPSEDGDSLTG